ncbi:transposase [Corynebacterium felinum]|nr:transposase [Corynebacterium felinum]
MMASCTRLVSRAGVLPFAHVAQLVGIGASLDRVFSRQRLTHTFGDACTGLALSLIAGGDDVKDINLLDSVSTALSSQPLPSVSTLWRRLTEHKDTSDKIREEFLHAIKYARSTLWNLLGDQAPHKLATVDKPLIVDIDATLICAHSGKEKAAPTYKKGFGFHPLCAFIDYTSVGLTGGEFLTCLLRPGNAGANTANDHCQLVKEILTALPDHSDGKPWGKRLVIRADSAGGTKQFLSSLDDHDLGYVVGFSPSPTASILLNEHIRSGNEATSHTDYRSLRNTRVPIVRGNGDISFDDQHFLEDITGLLQTAHLEDDKPLVNLLTDYPTTMRVIARIESPPRRVPTQHFQSTRHTHPIMRNKPQLQYSTH